MKNVVGIEFEWMCGMELEFKNTSGHHFIYLLDLLLIYICEMDNSDFVIETQTIIHSNSDGKSACVCLNA